LFIFFEAVGSFLHGRAILLGEASPIVAGAGPHKGKHLADDGAVGI
jgi:hypothetical protein